MATDAWRNWAAYAAMEPETENFQDEAYSDRRFIGGPVRLGPTMVHVIIRHADRMGPAVVLHTGIHTRLMPELVVKGELARANSEAYHGGTLSDEIAALIALDLGVRLRVAGTRTLSGFHDDGPSHPIHLEVEALARPGRLDREVIPRVMTRSTNVDMLTRVSRFAELKPEAAIPLVRSAREYASAVWWANEDADQAWLHLVSAVEVAAAYRQVDSAAPVDLLEEHWPDMWVALEGADEEVRGKVADVVKLQMRATRRFVDFITSLCPPPPECRPTWDRLDWNVMRRYAGIIYGHRSSALHAGKPFPSPMNIVPRVEEDGAIQESPGGLTSGAPGAIWTQKETPMLLSTFEYIVRGALLAWWDELIEGESATTVMQLA